MCSIAQPIKYSFTSAQARFHTPVVCDYDLQCTDLTASALYGGAVNQINSAIATAIAGKQDSVRWEAGVLSGQSTGPNVSGANYQSLLGSAVYVTTHPITFTTGRFTQDPLVFIMQNGGNTGGHSSIVRMWVGAVTTAGCDIVISDNSSSGNVNIAWFAVQADTL